MTSSEIREKFLKYFEGKGHRIVPSSSLIPANDPTLFFTNAGMVPFKDVFTGYEKRNYTTATTSQKCLRVSGKHNDLENVGRTPRHHTFFEMLGNFSFGDYFKKEAIAFGWEFLTKTAGIPEKFLWVSIFRDDEEAGALWKKVAGVSADKIIRCGEEDNFWSMGETGPCGPCSEIHIDLKLLHEGKAAKGNPSTNSDDFMELWNLVFMQYNRDETGKLSPLPKPSIDTGMGLERLAAVLQKKKSNFETDLFFPIIEFVSNKSHKSYGSDPETDVSMRVLADHIRATAFLIADGVQPANDGRGYVLRRIMRRAIRHGRLLGQNTPFFFGLVEPLVKLMGGPYPELIKNQKLITEVVKTEEERFLETLDRGLEIIREEIRSLQSKKKKVFSGETAFKLYDTFGFPVDLTQVIAAENNLSVNMKAFDAEMEKQKERARAAWKGSGEEAIEEVYHKLTGAIPRTQFVGYQALEADSEILALLVNGKEKGSADTGDRVEIFVAKTPFYGESGGQVGDKGIIESKSGRVEIDDTQKPLEGIISHRGKVLSGTVKVGDRAKLQVAGEIRRPTMINHTATHIMHAALRTVLGDSVRQAGSLVAPDRLRFDFTYYQSVKPEEIEEIERRVNEIVQSDFPVTTEEMGHDAAIKSGALAFFGDKYGDQVRVVSIGPASKEFCGGTHLSASGQVGAFKLIGEASVASGVRRVEAITGMTAIREFQKLRSQYRHLAHILKSTPDELPEKIKKLTDRVRELEGELTRLKTKLGASGAGGGDFMSRVKEINGVKFLQLETEIDDPKALREFSDQVKAKLGSGIAVIGSRAGGKVSLVVTVSADLTSRYKAGDLIREIAAVVGGKGGGRPDMAQAGGPAVDKLSEAFKRGEDLVASSTS